MRIITFDVKNNGITNDNSGTNDTIKIKFTNFKQNEDIVKLSRGAYLEKILLDADTITVSDSINIAPYFYVNNIKILTNKEYTYTTKGSGSGSGGDTTINVTVDNEDVLNQLSIIKSLITDAATLSNTILS